MTTTHSSISKNTSSHTHAGFTLIEALVSMFILSVTLTAIVSLVSRSIEGSIRSQQYLIASKLAQEGVELIRAKRNNNLVAQIEDPNVTWDKNLRGTWEVAYGDIGTSLSSDEELPSYNASVGRQTFRRFASSTPKENAGKFTYTNKTIVDFKSEPIPGNFSRIITVGPSDSNSEYVTIKSEVTWNTDETLIVDSVLYGPS